MDHSSQLRAFDEVNPFLRKWIEFTFDKIKLFGHYKTETDNFHNKIQNNRKTVDFAYFRNTFDTNMCPSTMSLSCQVHILN